MKKNRKLTDSYKFLGYQPYQKVKGIFGDPKSLIISMKRVQKKQYAQFVLDHLKVFMTKKLEKYGIYPAEINAYTLNWKYIESIAGTVIK